MASTIWSARTIVWSILCTMACSVGAGCAGLQSWLPHVSGLDTVHDVVEKFLKSPEGKARQDGLTDRAFVNKLYEDNLHRQADDTGLKGWLDALSHGASRDDVATGIVLSNEHLANLKGVFEAGDVARLYHTLLDRAPDAAGLHGWRDAIEHGTSLRDVAQGFLGSAEYQHRAGGLGNASYVDDLFVHSLGRHADDAGSRYGRTSSSTACPGPRSRRPSPTRQRPIAISRRRSSRRGTSELDLLRFRASHKAGFGALSGDGETAPPRRPVGRDRTAAAA